jgi:hypothetical protein
MTKYINLLPVVLIMIECPLYRDHHLERLYKNRLI